MFVLFSTATAYSGINLNFVVAYRKTHLIKSFFELQKAKQNS